MDLVDIGANPGHESFERDRAASVPRGYTPRLDP